jgi:hypothetical protein
MLLMPALGRNQITSADELNEYRMSNKVYPPSAAPQATREFRMMKFDGLAKSPPAPFRSWCDTSPRTKNQTLMVFMIRSP